MTNNRSAFSGISFLTGLSLFALSGTAARAADLGGDCCADLEERVATLEATTARKGNRKVSLTVSGHVNQALLFWDDGQESDAYVVSNSNDDGAMIRFEGTAKIRPGWTAGYLIEIEVGSANSGEVSQIDDGTNGVGLSESSMFIESEQWGRLTIGYSWQSSYGAPEVDLSGSGYVAYASIADTAGSFNWRLANGGLSGITLGDVFNDLNGDSFNIVRYDTPTIAGFTLSASWGEDDIWDVALNYEKEWGVFSVAGAVAYTENKDGDSGGAKANQKTVAGSVSVLHNPTGLNFTFATGQRDFDDTPLRNEATFYYFKGGLYRQFNSLGKTAFYGEYGQFDDMFYTTDAAVVGNLTAVAGAVIQGSEAEVFGFGLVQYVDAAAMQLFIGYRHYEVDFNVVNAAGAAITHTGAQDFDTVMAGARIEF